MKPFAALRMGLTRPSFFGPRHTRRATSFLPAAVALTFAAPVFAQAAKPAERPAQPAPSPATAKPAASTAPVAATSAPAAPAPPAQTTAATPPAAPVAATSGEATATGVAPTASAAPPAAPAPADAQLPPPYPTAPATDAAPPTDAAPATEPPPAGDIYEPPLPGGAAGNVNGDPVEEIPVPPPPSKHVAPRSSLWVGARPGLFVPMGAMWIDGEPLDDLCCVESVRPFSEFAGPGPSLGLDLGVRFARHYQAFAFWERAWLSSGGLEDAFGGQKNTSTSMFGGGFRFSTHPDAIGMVVELSLGYRTFEAEWESGTQLTASDDLFSTRLGFGVEWRINRLTTAELLLMVGGGAFTDVKWNFADGTSRDALTGYDRYGQYIPFGIQFASHWDVISSDD